jgi:hypothetical protein
MNRSKQAGMGKKVIIVLVVGLALASVHLAEAQPQARFLRLAGSQHVPVQTAGKR